MFNKYNKPGPSRPSESSEECPSTSIYDYPITINMNPQLPYTAMNRPGDSYRGARQNFGYNQNRNYYPQNFQWGINQPSQRFSAPIQSYQRQQNDKKPDFTHHKKDNKENKNKHQKNKRNQKNVDRKPESPSTNDIDWKLYRCPKCLLQFDYINRYNSYVGRIPLLLNCKHTVCRDCIYKLQKNDSIACPVCKNPSAIPENCTLEELPNVFFPNLFLMGFITWSKIQSSDPSLMTLVPIQSNSTFKKGHLSLSTSVSVQPSDKVCCFLLCNKSATLHCQDCNDYYCLECSTSIHKSAKSMWSHKPVSIIRKTKDSLKLEKCPEHNMDSDIYCVTCEVISCCYCFLDKHENHLKENLSKVDSQEMTELLANKEKAKKIQKILLITQKKLRELYSYSAINIEKSISNYFANYHARLQFIEKALKNEMNSYLNEEKGSLDTNDLNITLAASIDKITELVTACDALDTKKMNLKAISKELKNIQDTPCYLLGDEGKVIEPLEFFVEPLAENIEEHFKIRKNFNKSFKIVPEIELPSDYEKDSFGQEFESDMENCSISSKSKSVRSEDIKLVRKPNKSKQLSSPSTVQISVEKEIVDVTHIESLEKFYVRMKKSQYNFCQMNSNIDDYIKMGAPAAEHPSLNNMYLVLYQTNDEKRWCRGRIIELKNGETEPLFEVFFIDYGTTQTVNASKIKEITAVLSQKKPFAIQCQLYNPSMTTWGKNAHIYMGKILTGKQVMMIVKGVHSGIHEVDLMVASTDRSHTSVVDILIHACNNSLNIDSDNENKLSMHKVYSYNPGCKIYRNSTIFEKFQQEKVVLVNIIDPHHIFIHLVSNIASLKKMQDSLKYSYKNSTEESCLPIEGTYVVVNYNSEWYRGFIKTVDFISSQCEVLLVDHGLNITVPWTSIRLIQEEFTKLESQAILISLAHISPLNNGKWLNTANIFLENYHGNEVDMYMIVEKTDPLEVALYKRDGDVDICINALLVEENLAESIGTISKTIEWPRKNAEETGFNEEDGLLDSLLTKADEMMDNESDDESNDDSVRQKIEVVKFVSPDSIYIKFTCHENRIMELNKELQVFGSNQEPAAKSWNVDETCVVLHNQTFARAKVLEKINDNKYKVNIFDRAVEVCLSPQEMYEYNKYFNKFPSVVIKSHLANIRPAGGDTWSMSSIEALERLFEKFKNIYGTKVQDERGLKSMPMQMWYAQVKIGGALEASKIKFVSLNKLLVKMGFAYRLSNDKPTIKSSNSIESPSQSSSPFLLSLERSGSKSSSSPVGQNLSNSELKSEGDTTSESSQGTKDISKLFDAANDSRDWNQLMDEEIENKNNKKIKNDSDSPYHTHETEIAEWLPSFPIKERKFNAWITCAETNGILYLREEKLQLIYKDMEKNIKQFFDNNKSSTKIYRNWQPGQVCTISYQNSYYRGKVLKVISPDEIWVLMIDFGSDHKVSVHDLNREVLYLNIPAFASKIKLDRVYSKLETWLDSDYEALLDTITEYCTIEMKGSLNEIIPTAEVYTDKGVNVNEKLVKLCPNLTRSPEIYDNKSDDDVVIEEESIIEAEDQLVVEVEDHLNEDEENSAAVDTTKMNYKILSLPDKGDEKIQVTVMAILNYNKIAIKESSAVTAESFELTNIKNQPTIEHLEVGIPCACPFSEDGKWYRAQVYDLEGLDCGYVSVFFVDFGNIESVAIQDIKMMRPEWLDLPVCCHIANVNIEVKSDKHINHITQFSKKFYASNKLIKILSKDPLCVSLYDLNGDLTYLSFLKKNVIILKK